MIHERTKGITLPDGTYKQTHVAFQTKFFCELCGKRDVIECIPANDEHEEYYECETCFYDEAKAARHVVIRKLIYCSAIVGAFALGKYL